jgi:hypothetical protein
VAEISADVMLKTIVGHFLGDRDTYMTTELSSINGCIPDGVMVSDYGSSPYRGNFRLTCSPLPDPTIGNAHLAFNVAYLLRTGLHLILLTYLELISP